MVLFAQRVNGVTGSAEWRPEDDDYDHHQEISRSGFADMLHDRERNEKYYEALKKAIDKMHRRGRSARVLDIGTGTGLLSMMAARCGADSIVACEAFAPMAECARRIIAANGLADRITLVPKRSTDMTAEDLPVRPNILVAELFDTELIGEGAIETFAHAATHLLDDDPIIVPASATIYAQVAHCPFLLGWNRLQDVADEESGATLVRVPPDIKACPGSAAVHDVQLSQLPREAFRAISEPVAVFDFDWSAKNPPMTRSVEVEARAQAAGPAQMAFMWWDLKMDFEGEIILSCAPWWHHPLADPKSDRPEDTVPWRDHWMQAVYYFPLDVDVAPGDTLRLLACHDEYSLRFDLENGPPLKEDRALVRPMPACDCGAHMCYSRAHIAYTNDREKTRKTIAALKKRVHSNSTCLCVNGGSPMGLAALALGAKSVIYLEEGILATQILRRFISHNDLGGKAFIVPNVESLSKADLDEITLVIGDPHFNSAILPWDNLRYGHFAQKLNLSTKVIPSGCSVWVMCVEFLDLHKIKIPLGTYMGMDFRIFDDLIKNSRTMADDEIEPQPLWEYPCICRTLPAHVGDVDLTLNRSFSVESPCTRQGTYNGFVIWLKWNLDEDISIDVGPTKTPEIGQRVEWDPHVKQAVKILDESRTLDAGDLLECRFSYDLIAGTVNANVDIKSNNNK